MRPQSIYVEATIRAPMDEVWRLTQTPEEHERWDLRFSHITYLPRRDASEPQRFLYETRIGFGLRIRGEGETVGSHEEASGARTSALKFWSHDSKSLIREGSGFWKYEPLPKASGVRFFTRYNYSTRFGALGRFFDALVFRPLIGWATAWSFDAMRLWAEKGLSPETLRERAAIHTIARGTLALIWAYQGVFPKLLFPDGGELAILQSTQLVSGFERAVLSVVGWAEVAFGAALLGAWRSRALLWLNVILLVVLGLGAARGGAELWFAPFNPATLSLAMIALSACALLADRDLPSARRCLRRPVGEVKKGEDD